MNLERKSLPFRVILHIGHCQSTPMSLYNPRLPFSSRSEQFSRLSFNNYDDSVRGPLDCMTSRRFKRNSLPRSPSRLPLGTTPTTWQNIWHAFLEDAWGIVKTTRKIQKCHHTVPTLPSGPQNVLLSFGAV